MSADNWRKCPRCAKKLAKTRADKLAKAEAKYGKIPAAQYRSEIAEAEKPIKQEETLREDYEYWIDEEGYFQARYNCSCSRCDFEFSFKHAQDANP